MDLKFNELFGTALGCLIEACGGSMEDALDTMRIRKEELRTEIKNWYGWEEEYTVKVTNIDYCIEEEDVCDEIANDASIEEDSEEYYEAIQNKIKEIKADLPQTFTFTFECTEDKLDDLIAEEISDETSWLVNSFKKEII
jgi:ferritin-like protein